MRMFDRHRKQMLSSVAVAPIAIGLALGGAAATGLALHGGSALAQNNPCTPGAAKETGNPCNPCAAGKAGEAAAGTDCVVPRLRQASAGNPCAAKKGANPCNPCGAATKANPCNPCAASAQDIELTDAEAAAAYDCIYDELAASYDDTGNALTKDWKGWAARFSTGPYVSATHGGRFVDNYANRIAAEEYGKFEDGGPMPQGAALIKDSFTVGPDGAVSVGPLFIMEKMDRGFNPDTGDWRYIMFMPGGKLFGMTKGDNSAGMAFCHECHTAAEDNDYLFFLPDEYRIAVKP